MKATSIIRDSFWRSVSRQCFSSSDCAYFVRLHPVPKHFRVEVEVSQSIFALALESVVPIIEPFCGLGRRRWRDEPVNSFRQTFPSRFQCPFIEDRVRHCTEDVVREVNRCSICSSWCGAALTAVLHWATVTGMRGNDVSLV